MSDLRWLLQAGYAHIAEISLEASKCLGGNREAKLIAAGVVLFVVVVVDGGGHSYQALS